MHADAAAIRRLMIEVGSIVRVELEAPLERLGELDLDSAETLTLMTSTLAAVAHRRHGAAAPSFLRRVHDLTRPGIGRSDGSPQRRRRKTAITQGLRVLNAAFEMIAARSAERGLDAQGASLIEMATLARLFGTFRPGAIAQAVAAAATALARPDYMPGDIVTLRHVPVRSAELALAG